MTYTFTRTISPTPTGFPFTYTPTPSLTFTPYPGFYCNPLIDDLEDGDEFTSFGIGRWIRYEWSTGGPTNVLIDTIGANGTARSAMITGTDTTADNSTGFGVEAPLVNSGMDISVGFQGVRFWVRANVPAILRVNLKSAATTAGGDHYGYDFDIPVADVWRAVTVYSLMFSQTGSGPVTDFGSALASFIGIQWQTSNQAISALSLWIDEICVMSDIPTPPSSPTPTPVGWDGYRNTVNAVAFEMSCNITVVQQVRAYNLTPLAGYLVMRLAARTFRSVDDILALRANMGWDDICRRFGISWTAMMTDLKPRIRRLKHEPARTNQILRTGAYNLNGIPIQPPSYPPSGPPVFLAPFTEACP